jgi:hypothetical protein
LGKYYAVRYKNGGGQIVLTAQNAKNLLKEQKGQYKKFNIHDDAVNWINKNMEDGIYIDGCYSEIAKTAYWAVIKVIDNTIINIAGGIVPIDSLAKVKSVGGEMYAALVAAQDAIESKMTIYTDYNGLIKFMSGTYHPKKDGTKYFQQQMNHILENNSISIRKVKSHAGNIGNEIVDKILQVIRSNE